MESIHERELWQWDLYKSYGEFNFFFEDTVQEFKSLLISLVRISYNYFDDEDDDGQELSDEEQNRLLKIMMNNMGAMDVVKNCQACFIDYFSQQRNKLGKFSFNFFDEVRTLSEQSYNFALAVFKKSIELIELRNVIIHSHYGESLIPGILHTGKLKGQKDVKSAKGYEKRQFTYDIDFFARINQNILDLFGFVHIIGYNLWEEQNHSIDYKDELANLKGMSFSVVKPNP